MHEHIDDDIEDHVFKAMFKHELQKGTEKSGENIKSGLKNARNDLLKR
ncbi:hypothetical protein MMM5_06910 [Helicobacter pylori]